MSEIFMSNITNSYDITRSCDRHKVKKKQENKEFEEGSFAYTSLKSV